MGSPFFAIDDVIRDDSFDRFFKNILAVPAAKLESGWNGSGKLDEGVIQQGNTAFDGARHAHLVLLHEQFERYVF